MHAGSLVDGSCEQLSLHLVLVDDMLSDNLLTVA